MSRRSGPCVGISGGPTEAPMPASDAGERDRAAVQALHDLAWRWAHQQITGDELDAIFAQARAAARAEGAAEARAECERLTQDRSRFAADVPPVEHYTPDEWREKAIVLGVDLANAMDTAERACDEDAALRAEVGRLREACESAARRLKTYLERKIAICTKCGKSEDGPTVTDVCPCGYMRLVYDAATPTGRAAMGVGDVHGALEALASAATPRAADVAERDELKSEVERLTKELGEARATVEAADLTMATYSRELNESWAETAALSASNARLRAAAEAPLVWIGRRHGPESAGSILGQLRAALGEGGERGE